MRSHGTGLLAVLSLSVALHAASAEPAGEVELVDFSKLSPQTAISGDVEYVDGAKGKAAKAVLAKPVVIDMTFGKGANYGAHWQEFDQLVFELNIEGAPLTFAGFITDKETSEAAKDQKWFKRHNFSFKREPGKHRITFPLGALTREQAKGILDAKTIDHAVFSFASDDPAKPATVVINGARLVKGAGSYEVKVLYSFEGNDIGKFVLEDWPEDLKGSSKTSELGEHASHGNKALKLESGSPAGNVQFFGFDGDWSNYDTLAIDIFSTATEPHGVGGWIKNDDKAGWWDRHNFSRIIKPGFNSLKFAIGGIATPANIPKLLDTKKIARFNISVDKRTVFIDNVRLIKGVEEVPVAGLQKFDFGPEESALMPGFKKVTPATMLREGQGWGWAEGATFPRRAAFDINEILGRHRPPDDMCRDFVSPLKATFVTKVPNGKYTVWLMQGPPGNGWGTTFNHRTVVANGITVVDQKFDKESFKKHEFAFQDSEDLPGDDIWEKYINVLFKPSIFEVDVTDGELRLEFDSFSQPWCSMINGMVLWPKTSNEDAVRWLANFNDLRKEQFYAQHFEEIPKPKNTYTPPDDVKQRGYARFIFDPEEPIAVNHVPSAEQLARNSFDLVAAQDESENFGLGVYPLKDCGTLKLVVSDLKGPGGATIPASDVTPLVARYKAMNQLGRESTYTVAVKYLDTIPAEGIAIKTGVTRAFWLSIRTPENVSPGKYTGQVQLNFSAAGTDVVNVALEVYPFKLAEVDFPMGIFCSVPVAQYHLFDPGSEEYWNEWKGILQTAKAHGMTSIDPGITIKLNSYNAGKVDIDFSEADRFMKLAREIGFRQELSGYAINVGIPLKFGHTDFDAAARQLGAETYFDLVKAHFSAVNEHAKANNWLPICFSTGDEYIARSGDPDKMIAHHKILQSAAPGVRFGPCDSVRMGKSPESDAKMLQMLGEVDTWWASMHTPQIAEAIKNGGRRMWMYNTGQNRFIWGAYLTYARKKYDVKGFMQWLFHSGGTYGQFYLGSHNESALGMLYPSTRGFRSTPNWERIHSGCNDHRYFETAYGLMDRAKTAGKGGTEAKALEDMIEGLFSRMTFGNPRADALAAEGKADNPFTPEAIEKFRRTLAEGIIKLQSALDR
jgi:hypothetical protein